MSVPVAYATILIIWSTTPLGISWSNETVSPIAAIAMRMSLAAVIGFFVIKFLRLELSWSRKAIRAYMASLVGVYGALLSTYIAANYVPSGLISVIFALAPVFSNLFSVKLLGTGEFTPLRWLAFGISFFGLSLICLDDWVVQSEGWKGVALLLLAVMLYSLSGVLVQRENYQSHPLSMSVGTVILSSPLFVLTWFVMDGSLPQLDFSSRSPWSILYLAICGSLIGFMAYFYIVKQVGATAVAMVTLVTPVVALMLGSLLNHEPITYQMVMGTGGVLLGLLIYYQANSMRLFARLIRR